MIFLFLLELSSIFCSEKFANQSFDIIYINLKRSNDRNEHMEKLLKYAKCSFSRFEAIDGEALITRDRETLERIKIIARIEDYLKEGKNDIVFGCMLGSLLSHILVYNKIVNSQSPKPVLVLEDDVDLDVNFVEKLENIFSKNMQDWDILLLSGENLYVENEDPLVIPEIKKVSSFYLNHAYVINGSKAVTKTISFLNNVCYFDSIDILLSIGICINNLQVYATIPELAIQMRDKFKSTILKYELDRSRESLKNPISKRIYVNSNPV